MPIACHYNGSLCTKFFSDDTDGSNSAFGFIIGSIAFLIFIIVFVLIMYIVCCKRQCRQKLTVPFRSSSPSRNQEQSNDINLTREQSELNSRRSSNEQPPPYQEANSNINPSVYKNT
jgi:hypothetical protein